ncbi:MAG: branched-chain amino acid transaminase [bacterium]|nr:branched-chain amino acid transaminase [bacterium]
MNNTTPIKTEFDETKEIWFDGKFVPWKEATVHVGVHALHYGSAVFEGIRCYKTVHGPAIFRLKEHVRRLFDSAKICRMRIPYSREEIENACIESIRRNRWEEAYIRPLVFRGYASLGVLPKNNPINVVIMTWYWGKYLGPKAETGVDVMVSSWRRAAPDTFPTLSKSMANYLNSQLIKIESVAMRNGVDKENSTKDVIGFETFDEGIALNVNGTVSEGSGENLFLVREGIVYTPSLAEGVLPGITRHCVITILEKEMGLKVVETSIPREMLYICDELFFTGTAAEVTPIRSVDRIAVGEVVEEVPLPNESAYISRGGVGPITKELRQRLMDIVTGRAPDKYGWLTKV